MNTIGSTGQSTGSPSTSSTGTQTSSPATTGTTGNSTGTSTGGGTTTSTSSSTGIGTSEDASAGDDAGADDAGPTVGAGCAAGATVIVLTFSSGTNGNTGNFNTTGAVCVELMGSVHQGWGISNGGTRMVTVTSASGTAGPVAASGSLASLPVEPQAGSDGFVYWNFTADNSSPPVNYTSIYVF
ncbi:MAG TPA: hypothetical protein VEK07_03725 [Polyangiaceae bacterium]|nr:hypothetical protein [Polyangiaceae bacterium]